MLNKSRVFNDHIGPGSWLARPGAQVSPLVGPGHVVVCGDKDQGCSMKLQILRTRGNTQLWLMRIMRIIGAPQEMEPLESITTITT